MDVDGTLAESGGLRDFENVEFFDKSKQEDRPLFIGKASRRFPHGLELVVDKRSLFRRNLSIGKPVSDQGAVHRRALRFPPELKSTGAYVISKEIHGDAHEPGVDAGGATERCPVFISLEKAILGQCLGDIRILDRGNQEAQNPWPVALDNLIEVLDLREGIVDICGNETGSVRFHCTPLDEGSRVQLNTVTELFC